MKAAKVSLLNTLHDQKKRILADRFYSNSTRKLDESILTKINLMNHFENYLQFFLYPLNPFQLFLFEKCPRHRSIHPTLLSNTKNSSSSLLSLDTPLSKASTDIPFPSRKTLFSLPKHVPRESFDHSSFRYEQPRGRDASSLRTKVHTHTHIHKIA